MNSSPRSVCGENVAVNPQKEALTKRIRSRSRSTTMRTATLCTRPADNCGITFFQSTGDTS